MAEVLANPVAGKLASVADRLLGVAIIDTPTDSKLVKDFRDANGAAHVYMVSPQVKIGQGSTIKAVPMSGYAAGVFAAINFWESPSNREVFGILGTSEPVSFSLSDPNTKGQLLNAIQVATIVRQDGFRLWGARGTGDTTDAKTNQIQKVRIRNAIREAILASHRWAVAQGITRNYFEAVAGSVNKFLEDLKRRGAIAGGACIPDAEANTIDNLNNGKVAWIYDFTPTPVSEKMTFTEEITDKYLEGIGA